MNQFDHPNILKRFDKEPLCLIFEYMDLGDLNNYLRKTAKVLVDRHLVLHQNQG